MRILYLFIFFVFSCATTSADQSRGRQFYFEASRPGENNKKIFLYGSIHVGGPYVGTPSAAVLNQFKKSKMLAVEFDVRNMTFEDFRLRRPVLTTEDVIEPQVAMNIRKSFDKKFARTLLENDVCESSQRMVLQILSEDKDFDLQKGIDRQFLELSKNKPVKSLESLEDTVNLVQYGSFSREEMIKICSAPFLELNEGDFRKQMHADLMEIVSSWQNGDDDQVNSQMWKEFKNLPSPLREKVLKRFLDQRNQVMSVKMLKYFDEEIRDGSLFVVIGSAHLIGENSVMSFLQKAGFKVRRLDPRDAIPPMNP